MNWKALFKPTEILTAADRAELERLEDSTKQLRDLAARIEELEEEIRALREAMGR